MDLQHGYEYVKEKYKNFYLLLLAADTDEKRDFAALRYSMLDLIMSDGFCLSPGKLQEIKKAALAEADGKVPA